MEQYARGHFEKCVINEAYPFLFYEIPKFGKSAFHGIVSKNRLLKEIMLKTIIIDNRYNQ
jgi:hypothetical protein